MISSDKAKLIDDITKIDVDLNECSNIYRSCTNTDKLTTNLEVKLKATKVRLKHLANSFDGTQTLTNTNDGHILIIESEAFALEKDMDRLIRCERELRGLVSPWLNTLLIHKRESIELMNKTTPKDVSEEDLHAYILNGFVSILITLKTGWDAYLGFLKNAYLDIFKFI